MSDELFTRDSFIADYYVQIAISNANTIWSKDGPLREIPMPQSIKESGVLPEGYCVGMFFFLFYFFKTCSLLLMTTLAFMHDPATTIRGLASIGINYPRYDIVHFYNSIMTITH